MKFFDVRSRRRRLMLVVLAAVLIASLRPWGVELRRTACAGLCPDYTVKVWSNGLVQYHGNFGLVTGDRMSYIGPFQAQYLMSLFLLFGFPFFEDTYSNGNIDFPGSTTCLLLGWLWKCVNVAFSMEPISDPPIGLNLLNRAIDAVVYTERWTGTVDQLKEKYIHPQQP